MKRSSAGNKTYLVGRELGVEQEQPLGMVDDEGALTTLEKQIAP
jgi:hypothetical protein